MEESLVLKDLSEAPVISYAIIFTPRESWATLSITTFSSVQGAYGFGYDVGPNGQFHHETRGPDGVTYGCYGYVDPDGYLRATHYVADSHGYRVVEPNKPVEVYPELEGDQDT